MYRLPLLLMYLSVSAGGPARVIVNSHSPSIQWPPQLIRHFLGMENRFGFTGGR